jgi:sortase B
MTSAYSRRPSARNSSRKKTREAAEKDNQSVFINWQHPKNAVFGFVMTIIGIVPLAVLAFFNWVVIDGGQSGAENFYLPLSDFVLSGESARYALDSAVANSMGISPLDDLLIAWFRDISFVYTMFAVIYVAALLIVLLAALSCTKPVLRNSLAFFGYGLSATTSVAFIVSLYLVNYTLDSPMFTVGLFPFLSLLSALLAMVYCVRFPVLAPDAPSSGEKNSRFTKAVTSFVPVKGDGTFESVRKSIFTVALICFVYFGSTVGIEFYSEWQASRIRNDLENRAKITLTSEELRDPVFDTIREHNPRYFLDLFRQNPDTVGFIRIGDTRVQYAVVQGQDNDFYLNRNFEGAQSNGGWIFADFRNRFFDSRIGPLLSRNTVLYGHNHTSGAYFTQVSRYYSWTVRDRVPTFYRENPIITFDTLFERMEWKVFAAVLFNTEERNGFIVPYWNTHEFADEDEFHEFIIDIMDRSVIHTDVDIQYGDHILTLSTCHHPLGRETANTRAVAFARRLRPGETIDDFDVNAATFNSQRYFGDFEPARRRWGSGQRGVWDRDKYLTSYNQ